MSLISPNLVQDMISLYNQEWMDDDHKKTIRGILLSAVDNMKDYVEELEKHR